MKQLLWVIVAMMVLGAVVPGCDDVPRYDGRLTAADSLIHDHADSALTMLEALAPTDLATEGDRAYHDLLLTQARYKCYKPATTDSAINRALAYYRAHPKEREKLTRAYIYKGAVMEELGHPDSAMLYYKTAEATADTCDYANLGHVYTRTACLYREYYGDEQKCFEKYQLAYRYHTLSGNKKLQLNSLYNMSMMIGITHQEEYEEYMNQAIKLAEDIGDPKKLFEITELRCRQLSRKSSTRQEAKLLALDCLSKYRQYANNDLFLDLAYLYAFENKQDSVSYFLSALNEELEESEKDRIKIRKTEILSLNSLQTGNIVDGSIHVFECNHLSDSILNNTKKYNIEKIDGKIDQIIEDGYLAKIHLGNGMIRLLSLVATIAIIAILLLIILRHIQAKKTRSIIEGLKSAAVDDHADMIDRIDDKNDIIEQMVVKLISFMKSYSGEKVQCSTSEMHQYIKDTFGDIIDDVFWNELASYSNRHYKNIISIIAGYPQVKNKDIRFIELMCCGFSDLEIAVIMNYSTKYVWNKKKNLAQKLGINVPLQEYLNGFLTSEP